MVRHYAVKLPHKSTGKIPLSRNDCARIISRAVKAGEDHDIRRRIKQRLEQVGLTPRSASLKAGGSADLIRGLLRGKQRSFRGENLAKLAAVLGVSATWLLTGEDGPEENGERPPTRVVPIVGYVGAGSEAHYYDIAQSPDEFASLPAGVNIKSIVDVAAIEIRGDSLGNFLNGWLVFYDDVKAEPDPSMLRELCVVGLTDGRVLVKKLMKGSTPGRYHLLSQTEGMIEDVEVLWAAKVRAMAPK